MRAVVYQHESHEELARLGPALAGAGFALVKRFRAVKHQEDLSAELLVVLGGPMSARDTTHHPFLADELGVLTERLALERPCLGVCLGAQLLARAAGAEVTQGKNGLEAGAAPVRWTEAGQKDAVTAGLGGRTVVAHWHEDTFGPVPGAALLASTDRYTQQAFRLGPHYGFQFHPELSADDFGQWLELGQEELALHGRDLAELKTHLPKLRGAEPALKGLLERLAHHFAAAARGR